MKTLNEKLAEFMGWTETHAALTITLIRQNQSFDAFWPVWVRFRDWRDGKQRIPRDIVNLHLDWVERISNYITYFDTPAPAFELLVEGVEWLNSLNNQNK